MFRFSSTFFKYQGNKKSPIVELYFDDLMFYLNEVNAYYSRDELYDYKHFLRLYLNFTDEMLRLFEHHHAESISRRIRAHMKDLGVTEMPLDKVVEFLEKDVIIYIFKNGLYDIIARPYPEVLFERAYGNPKKDTFDHITLTFSIVNRGRDTSAIIKWIKTNKKHMHYLITSSISPKLESKYGISMNYIKVDSCILTRDYRLVYKLSLKDI